MKIDAALNHLKSHPLPGVWEEISLAPKDGTPVLVWHESWVTPVLGYWDVFRNKWLEWGARDPDANIATHWMHLPSGPDGENNQ